MSSWASTMSWPPKPAKGTGEIKDSIAVLLKAACATRLASHAQCASRAYPRVALDCSSALAGLAMTDVVIASPKRSGGQSNPGATWFSRRALGREARMDDGAVAGQGGRLYDFVVPFHRQRLGGFVDQNFQEGHEVLGVKGRSGGRDAARDIEMADDLDAARLHHLAGLGEFAIAAALDREIDDHRARPHRLDHVLGDQAGRRAARDQRGRDHDILLLDVLGHQRRLLGLVLL